MPRCTLNICKRGKLLRTAALAFIGLSLSFATLAFFGFCLGFVFTALAFIGLFLGLVLPVGDEPEPNGHRVNMGAYGGTVQASLSQIATN